MLLFIDGFDHYATADITKKWSSYSYSTIGTGTGRRGGNCLNVQGTSRVVQKNFAAHLSSIIVGMAFKYSGTDGATAFGLRDGVVNSTRITMRSDGRIQIMRGDTTVVASSLPGVIPLGEWFYLEAKYAFGETTGAAEVRVNGNTVIGLTNVNTSDSGVSGYSNIIVGAVGTGSAVGAGLVDDLYLCDTSGSVNNDFLGDCRVDAYLPTSDGALSAWTPEPAGVHYTTVDDATPNATDYVSSATVGNKELFGVPDMINTPLSIFGVQLAAAAWKTDAGFREIKNIVRVSGTDYPSSALAVTETSAYKLNIWDQNPATSTAWTDAAVNAAEWGVEVA